jgi:hypothetical protein
VETLWNAKDVQDLLNLKKGPRYDMIVSSADLPQDDNTPLVPGENRGIRILSSLRESGQNIPYILVLEAYDQELASAVLKHRGAQSVVRTLNFGDDLCSAARSLGGRTLSPNPVRHIQRHIPAKHIQVTISAEDNSSDSWRFFISDESGSVIDLGDIKLNDKTVKRLIDKSRWIADTLAQDLPGLNWEYPLRELGATLMSEIKNSTDFNRAFNLALPHVDKNMRHVKIWFRIGKNLHPIVLEALVPDQEGEQFWMLQAPIYRRLSVPAYTPSHEPLFNCGKGRVDKRIRCLIIEADTSGVPNPELKSPDGHPVELKKLKYIQSECDEVCALLESARNVTRLKKISHATPNTAGRSFRETVQDSLSNEKWDLVHYSGHSYFDGEEGYVFFPSPSEGSGPEAMRISDFAAYLTRTRFLFLSSCQSSQDSFVLALARCNVVAVAGYRWPVHDRQASRYAVSFYHHLFNDKERCLQHAFLDARRDAFNEFRNDTIWAAPVLMIQAG